jgi:hypothetical protein
MPEISDSHQLRDIINILGDSATGNENLVIEAHRILNRIMDAAELDHTNEHGKWYDEGYRDGRSDEHKLNG